MENRPVSRSRRLGSARVKVNGPRVRQLRVDADETLREVAGRAQIDVGHLSRIETSPARSVTLTLYRRLCGALGVDLEELKATDDDLQAVA